MNKKARGGGAVAFIIIILLILLVWGFLGGQEAKKVGVTCDMGLGDNFCWTWHKNIVGEIQEGIENTGDVISDFFEDLG